MGEPRFWQSQGTVAPLETGQPGRRGEQSGGGLRAAARTGSRRGAARRWRIARAAGVEPGRAGAREQPAEARSGRHAAGDEVGPAQREGRRCLLPAREAAERRDRVRTHDGARLARQHPERVVQGRNAVLGHEAPQERRVDRTGQGLQPREEIRVDQEPVALGVRQPQAFAQAPGVLAVATARAARRPTPSGAAPASRAAARARRPISPTPPVDPRQEAAVRQRRDGRDGAARTQELEELGPDPFRRQDREPGSRADRGFEPLRVEAHRAPYSAWKRKKRRMRR